MESFTVLDMCIRGCMFSVSPDAEADGVSHQRYRLVAKVYLNEELSFCSELNLKKKKTT